MLPYAVMQASNHNKGSYERDTVHCSCGFGRMRSVRALLLIVACSSVARIQALTPREKYVQRMTDCLETKDRPATCGEYRDKIKNIHNNYNLKILNLSQSLSGECYVYAEKEVKGGEARGACAGGLLPWFLKGEEGVQNDVLHMSPNRNNQIWLGFFKMKNDWTSDIYKGWKGMCPAKPQELKPIEPKDIKGRFHEPDSINDNHLKVDVGARCTSTNCRDRPLDVSEYHFICMTVILPPQTSSPPPPTTRPSTSRGPPAPAPTASKAPSLATELIIGLILMFLCLIGLSAFMFLIMKKKRQKLEQAQRDAEQQDKTKEKDELSAGATQSQSCYTEGTTATETATPTMTPVMMPVHLGDTKEQCSGKKSCLCAMCRAKKEMLGEKIPEKEEEKGVVSLVSDML